MSPELFILPEMRHISGWTKHWTEAKNYQLISKSGNLLYGTISCKRGRPIGICRTDNRQPYGQICTPRLLDLGQTANDRKRKKKSGGKSIAVVRNGLCISCGNRRSWCLIVQMYKIIRGCFAYEDLGTEAIRKLQVENLPVIVVIDSEGNNLYETAIREHKR